MNKRILHIIVALFLSMSGVFAQTVQLETVVDAVPGTVSVDLNMNGFTGANGGIGAVTLNIDYDPTVLLGIPTLTNKAFSNITRNVSNGHLIITWFWTDVESPYPDINGLFVTLNFDYPGGFATDLVFNEPLCEVTQGTTPITPMYVDGSVSNSLDMDTYTGTAYLMSGYADVGETISWPLATMGNLAITGAFQTINSFTFHLSYDPTKLTYQSLTPNPSFTGVAVSGGNGLIHVGWSGATAQDLSDKLLGLLNFTYIGGGAATLSFEPGSIITSGTTIQNTYFVGGTVDVFPTGPFDGSITISQVGSTMGTANVDVPVVASGLSDNPAGAINFKMTFDPAELTYKGYTANQFAGWVVSQSPAGTLNFIKTSITPLTIADGPLVTLKFDYLINTQADITFMGGTSIQSPSFAYIPTDYVDGFISTNYTLTATAGAHGTLAAAYTGSYFWGTVVPIEGVANTGYKFLNWTGTGAANIADVMDATTTVTIPASDIAIQANFEVDPAQTFALTLTLGANGSAVTGDGSYNVEHVQAITATAATGYRFLNWTGTGSAYVTSLTSASTNVTMPALAIGLTANFEVDPAQTFALTLTLGANGSAVTGDGSYTVGHVQAITATPLTGYYFVNWTGTGAAYVADVNDPTTTVTMPALAIGLTANFAGYSVSGTVKYANTAGPVRPITNSRVYLKTSDGLTVLQTTISDASGNFTFSDVADGSYKLDADSDKTWGGLNAIDYVVLKNHLNGSAILTGLKWIAADITNNSVVNAIDGVRMKNRISSGSTVGWVRPNWNFQQESVTVSGSGVTVNVLGICTGDVNASYTPPL